MRDKESHLAIYNRLHYPDAVRTMTAHRSPTDLHAPGDRTNRICLQWFSPQMQNNIKRSGRILKFHSVDFLVNFQLKSCGGDGIKSQFLVAWVVGICSPSFFSSSKMHDWFLMLTHHGFQKTSLRAFSFGSAFLLTVLVVSGWRLSSSVGMLDSWCYGFFSLWDTPHCGMFGMEKAL